ncbi:MAG: hypothetical protein E6772_06955 [Dysgonomonas sp.]|nr:hypothetical protein [Dysgonomonas sp.]
MKKLIYISILIFSVTFIAACGDKKNEDAIRYLENIRSLYERGDYNSALEKIDSIQTLYPKAFAEIKEGLALKQEVRKASDERQILESDSLITVYQPQVDSIKKLFVYRKEAEDESGVYIPKAISANTLSSTVLRAGVNDDGSLYLESVYVGGQFHNRISVSTKDKQSAESLPIEDDGFNFRFSNLGQQYEVIKVTQFHDNGLTDFVIKNADKPLTVTLKGKHTTSFALPNVYKKAITDSYNLSQLMLLQDSLITAKDKAQVRIKYLDSKAKEEPVQEAN